MAESSGTPEQTKRDRQKQREEQRRYEQQQQNRVARRQSAIWTLVVVGALAGAAAALVMTRPDAPPSAAEQPLATPGAESGVETYPVTDQSHVEGPVDYELIPPVGGPHAPAWQNCGVYDAPIANENAVHSMEHGAVWIAHAPDLPTAELDVLHSLAAGDPYVLVTPHPDVAGVVASAWTKQLALDTPDEQRVGAFVTAFAQGPQTPEPGAPCTGGIGEPVG